MYVLGLVVHAGAATQRLNNAEYKGRTHAPKYEIRMGHKVRYAFEHAPRL